LPADPLAMSLPPNATNEEAEALRQTLGLDRTIPEQYVIWLGEVVKGNLGHSIHDRQDVLDIVLMALPATIELALVALVLATVIGIVGGMAMFYVRHTRKEPVVDLVSTVMMSIPEFLWAIFLILAFGVAWNILPFMGRFDPAFTLERVTGFVFIDALVAGRFEVFFSALEHIVLPAFSLALAFSPLVMRTLRSSLLEVILEDYITLARLRGISEIKILVFHALRNAALPTISLIGVQFGFLFGGTLLVEVIYSYPGLGNQMVEAVRNHDLPIIQAVALTYCLVILLINAVIDVSYYILNPKLRLS
jgi:peptide/nickel transport system permease protein